MKKQKLGLALTAVLLLTGCGGIEKMTETTVTRMITMTTTDMRRTVSCI